MEIFKNGHDVWQDMSYNDALQKYRIWKENKDTEDAEKLVKELADKIGILQLYEIAREIKGEG